MICKNCGHGLVEVEVPDFQGNVHNILVHKKQAKDKLHCQEMCFCGCEKAEPLEGGAKKNE